MLTPLSVTGTPMIETKWWISQVAYLACMYICIIVGTQESIIAFVTFTGIICILNMLTLIPPIAKFYILELGKCPPRYELPFDIIIGFTLMWLGFMLVGSMYGLSSVVYNHSLNKVCK